MYLMRDNPKCVLQQGADNDWTYKGDINKMHRCYTDNNDDDLPTSTSGITYNVSASYTKRLMDALIDRGANGGVSGMDVVWIGGPDGPPRYVAITGINNHQIPNICIGTVGAYAMSNRGPIIMIFNS